MIFAVHLKVKMAGKENRAKKLLEKFITDDIGIKAVHDFKDPIQYITETKSTVRCKSKIPGYIFIEMDDEFIYNNDDYRKDEMPAKTWHFLKSQLCAFNINILGYHIPAEQLYKYFDVEEVVEETEDTTVVISINKEIEELIEIEELEEETHHHTTIGNKFIDVFCVAVKNAKTLLSTKEGRTRLNISRRLWKNAYSLFDPFRTKNKEAFISNHTYLPFLIRVIQESV